MHRSILCTVLLSLISCSCASIRGASAKKPALAEPNLDLITSYSIYAKEKLWHDADVGGYWGGGVKDPAGDNGAIRGTAGIMFGYAMLVHAMDEDWLSNSEKEQLHAAQLDRGELLKYIRANLRYIVAHHKSMGSEHQPKWGFSWQSAFWIGIAGPAAIVVWRDLPEDLKRDFAFVVSTEADRIAGKPPKDFHPHDTGAEENGWDTHAPAVALALMPHHPNAGKWWEALRSYAMNTYSIKADRYDETQMDEGRVCDWVNTANVFDDLTLDNHGFFHPDYVQVSAAELGDSLMFLELGDRMNGTDYAKRFKPYAMHHVKDVWEQVARPLILPDGELTFPNSTDWQVNNSMTPDYLAFIATEVGDPDALRAAEALPRQALAHRAHSKDGRICGDSNMEWFWEPILMQRMSDALLEYEIRGTKTLEGDAKPYVAERYFPDSAVWLYRNGDYFVSAGWVNRKMGTFSPFYDADHPYMTLPYDGILPREVESFEQASTEGDAHVLTLRLKGLQRCAVICFPHSVLWVSPIPLRGISIQNDRISGGVREIFCSERERHVVALQSETPFRTQSWLNIDDKFGMITAGEGFQYTPAKGFNHRSTSTDDVTPRSDWGCWQMVANTKHEEMAGIAAQFNATHDSAGAEVMVMDGAGGTKYLVRIPFTSDRSKLAVEKLSN